VCACLHLSVQKDATHKLNLEAFQYANVLHTLFMCFGEVGKGSTEEDRLGLYPIFVPGPTPQNSVVGWTVEAITQAIPRAIEHFIRDKHWLQVAKLYCEWRTADRQVRQDHSISKHFASWIERRVAASSLLIPTSTYVEL